MEDEPRIRRLQPVPDPPPYQPVPLDPFEAAGVAEVAAKLQQQEDDSLEDQS